MRTIRTAQNRQKFLDALAECANVTKAAETANIARNPLYNDGISALEDEVMRRARDGVLEPVYQQGREVGAIRKYGGTLAMFLLNGRRPERYRNNLGISGPGSGPVQIEIVRRIIDAENGQIIIVNVSFCRGDITIGHSKLKLIIQTPEVFEPLLKPARYKARTQH